MHKELLQKTVIAAADKNYVAFKEAASEVLEDRMLSALKHITSEKSKSIFSKEQK